MTSPNPQAIPPTWTPPPPTTISPEPVQPGPVGPAPTARKKGGSRSSAILLAIGGLVAVAGVAFAVGRVTAPTVQAAGAGAGRFQGNGQGNGGGGFVRPSLAPGQTFAPGGFGGGGRGLGGAFGGGIQGTVTEVTADHVTVTLAGGQTVTVPVDGSTTYHQESAATQSGVTTGAKVRVQVALGGQGAPGGQGGQTGQNGQITLPGPASDILILQQ